MSQQSPSSDRSYYKKHKRPVLVSIALASLVIALVAPIIPIQKTVTKTRTRNLQYYSQLYDKESVNITNVDSIGGNFSVTMNYWVISPTDGRRVSLEHTSTQSSFINAGASQVFYAPSDWHIYQLSHALDYSVSASTQEAYDATITEYNSVLNIILAR